MEAIKKSTNKNTKKLREKSFSVERKSAGQIRSIHYSKIDITILKSYPRPELIINWKKKTIISLGTNTTSPQNPQFIFLVCLEQKKNHIFFFPSVPRGPVSFKTVFHSSISLTIHETHVLSFIYKALRLTLLQLGIGVFDFLCNCYTYFYMK